MAEGRYISYTRVSTDRQGRSGLGLSAQDALIEKFLNGGSWTLLAGYTEVESGKKNDRPQLQAALEDCRRRGATLLIAKIDRLSRDAGFLLNLQKSGVDFVAADMPEANRLTVGLLSVLAEHERQLISERTEAALAAAKARGQRLGTPENLTQEARIKGAEAATEARVIKADDFAARLRPLINDLQAQGLSLNGIARRLNEDGVLTARGRRGGWTARAVLNLLGRKKD